MTGEDFIPVKDEQGNVIGRVTSWHWNSDTQQLDYEVEITDPEFIDAVKVDPTHLSIGRP